VWCSDVLVIQKVCIPYINPRRKHIASGPRTQSQHSYQNSSDGFNRKEGADSDGGAEGVTDSDRVSFVAFKVKRGTIISA
jgi:hypothetical protein